MGGPGLVEATVSARSGLGTSRFTRRGDVSIAKEGTEPLVQSEQAVADQDAVAVPTKEDGAGEFERGDGPARRPKRVTNPPRCFKDYSVAR
jgi:hypothetical protein